MDGTGNEALDGGGGGALMNELIERKRVRADACICGGEILGGVYASE